MNAVIVAVVCAVAGGILLHRQELRHRQETRRIAEYWRNALLRHVTRGGSR